MTNSSNVKARTILRTGLVVLLVSLALMTITSTVFLDRNYAETRPREPRPAEGRIYGETIHHGTLVYLTRTEKLALDFGPAVCVVLFGAAFFLHHRWQGKKP